MTARGAQTLTWNAENKLASVVEGASTTTFAYDGDGVRVKKTEDGQTTVYPNRFDEKNLTTGMATSYLYWATVWWCCKRGARWSTSTRTTWVGPARPPAAAARLRRAYATTPLAARVLPAGS